MYNIDFTIRDKKKYDILSIFKMYKQKQLALKSTQLSVQTQLRIT